MTFIKSDEIVFGRPRSVFARAADWWNTRPYQKAVNATLAGVLGLTALAGVYAIEVVAPCRGKVKDLMAEGYNVIEANAEAREAEECWAVPNFLSMNGYK